MEKLTNFSDKMNRSSNKIVESLNQTIEMAIVREIPVVVCTSTKAAECRNTFCIDDYEIDHDYLYLNGGNFEMHIDFNFCKMEKTEDDEECINYAFIYHDMEIRLIILQ